LSAALQRLGLQTGRLKTGTCPRLDTRTIDYSGLAEQPGQDPAPLFSFDGPRQLLPQLPCYITYTNEMTHSVISKNIALSPIYSGEIESLGPRYCPSIEDKVMKFPDRNEHRIFLEPEGLDTAEVYPNGLSTSLPYEVQKEFVRTIPGLENAVIVRPGYAIEYDYVIPTQLGRSLETLDIAGLFLAGQINGTTGYEEAGAQGLVAGVNAARRTRGEDAMIFDRAEAYIGVMIDDLVTRGVDGEPYRMFTSRAEFRLLLREDNADVRLADKALTLGLLSSSRVERLQAKRRAITAALEVLHSRQLTPSAATNTALAEIAEAPLSSPCSAFDLLRRPKIDYGFVAGLLGLERPGADVEDQVTISAHYDGYICRQRDEIRRMRGLELTELPVGFDFALVAGLSNEATEKLSRTRPATLAQVSRMSGLTPAAVSALAVHLKKSESA
jgi:tRNA uridine 5-carboxymethylaminomethyl modification enzyme